MSQPADFQPAPDEEDPAKPAEPAITVGAITGAVTAVLVLLVSFGAGITNDQGAAIVALVTALGFLAPVVSGWVTRGKVTPVLPAHITNAE